MIGVVGETAGGGLAAGLRDAGVAVELGDAGAVLEAGADVAVAADSAALADLVAAGVDVPVLLCGGRYGAGSVGDGGVEAAVEALAAGTYATRDHRLLGVESAGEPVGRAALDVMLVRAEPGRISEFGVRAGGTRSRFRADGIVLATPLGSHGYAHDAGGPRLAPGVGAVTVVPVAAFGLGAPTWVVDPAGGVRLSVERDEGDVSLLVDGRERHRLAGRAAVDVATDGVLTTVDLDGG